MPALAKRNTRKPEECSIKRHGPGGLRAANLLSRSPEEGSREAELSVFSPGAWDFVGVRWMRPDADEVTPPQIRAQRAPLAAPAPPRRDPDADIRPRPGRAPDPCLLRAVAPASGRQQQRRQRPRWTVQAATETPAIPRRRSRRWIPLPRLASTTEPMGCAHPQGKAEWQRPPP